MGTDVHGRNATRAAERAVFDAIHHSSLNLFAHVDKTRHDMRLTVLIGVPSPEEVDVAKVAAVLPYGEVAVEVSVGGLEIPSEDGNDPILIANAGILVQFEE
tara:strand:+ start:282 stop:587 length:306 start_codon:yes stop_codon:yes gene_type:complete